MEKVLWLVETEENQYKIGLWVRDSAAGVGTVTFYEPQSKTFAALGHGSTETCGTGKRPVVRQPAFTGIPYE